MVRALARKPDFARALVELSGLLRSRDRRRNPHYQQIALAAWRLAPEDLQVRRGAEWAMRREVPRWHFPMLHDEARTDVYARALSRFVTPETTVLEIGSGSGIIAMLAARAGARHVYTCEATPLLADVARENVAANGLGERVTVISKPSTELVVGRDIPGPADLLVSELLDNNLLGELAIPTLEDAKLRLLAENARILPAVIGLRGCLVERGPWSDRCWVGEVRGLDLRALNRLAPVRVPVPVTDLSLDGSLSEPVDLLRLDFVVDSHFPSATTNVPVEVRQGGSAWGVLHWLRLEFGDGIELDLAPPMRSVWHPVFHAFLKPLPVSSGDEVRLTVAHDRVAVSVSLEG